MADNKVKVEITGSSAGATAAMNEAKASVRSGAAAMEAEFKGIGESLSGLHSNIKNAFEFIGAAAAIEGIRLVAEGLNQAAERAEHFRNAAMLVGATTSEFQGLAATAAQAGVPMETLQRGMLTLSQRMTMARDGSQQAREQLAKVGITAADLANPAFTAANALYTVAKSGAAMGDVQVLLGQRSAMLTAAFGKLAGGQKAMEEEAQKVGALNQQEIERLDHYKESVALLGIEFDNFKARLASAIIPIVETTAEWFSKLFSTMGGGSTVLGYLKGGFMYLYEGLLELIGTIKEVTDGIIGLFDMAGKAIGGFGALMHELVTGQWGSLKGTFQSIGTDIANQWHATLSRMNADVAVTMNAVKELESGPKSAGKAGPESRPDTGGGGTGGIHHAANNHAELAAMHKLIADKRKLIRQELAEMTKEMHEEVQVAQTGYKAQLDAHLAVLDRETAAVKNAAREGMIGPEQEFVQLRAILQQKLAAQTEYYEKLKQLAVGNRVELAKLDAAEQKDQQAYLTQVSKLHEQATAQIDRQWNMVANKIGAGWSSMIDKMLQGTMNFHQMITRTLDQMLMNFIRMETMSLAHHLATEAAKAEASRASSLVQQASAQDASKEGILQSGMAAMKMILNYAYQAAAGAFNAMVGIPVAGPVLAPAAAATALSAVKAFSGSIASASGGFDIPSGVNPITQLHQREMVLPAPLADTVRNGLTGGGGTHNYQIHAFDSQSFENYLLANPDAIRAGMQRAMAMA